MLRHICEMEDQAILGQRPNPLNDSWTEWTLVACTKCKRVTEWQHHSEEQVHGGDLEITAMPTPDYLRRMYGLTGADVERLLTRKMKVRRYDRHTREYRESYVP